MKTIQKYRLYLLIVLYCALHWCAVTANVVSRAHYYLLESSRMDSVALTVEDALDTLPIISDALAVRRLTVRNTRAWGKPHYPAGRAMEIVGSILALALGSYVLTILANRVIVERRAISYAFYCHRIGFSAAAGATALCAVYALTPYGYAGHNAGMATTIATVSSVALCLLLAGIHTAIDHAARLMDRAEADARDFERQYPEI